MRLAALLLLLPLVLGGGTPSIAMNTPRAAHTATLLASGEVLLAGGCSADSCELDSRGATTELFDPRTDDLRPGPRMTVPRVGHVAVRLRDGTVLVAGGWDERGTTAAAELYDPRRGRFEPAGRMTTPRGGATATLLRDGRVLVLGGTAGGGGTLRSAELFEPAARRFVATGSLSTPRGSHAAAALPGGRVLVAGGSSGGRVLASTELFDPRTGRFRPGPRMTLPRHKHGLATLRNGSVLVVGGSDARDWRGRYASAEILDLRRGRATRVRPMASPRFKLGDSVVRLRDGSVLVAGGAPLVERYQPSRRRFSPAGRVDASLAFATATALADGRVLVAGGYDDRLRVGRRAWLVPAR